MKKAKKLFLKFICLLGLIAFSGMVPYTYADNCPDPNGNCNITGEYQINSSTALKIHVSTAQGGEDQDIPIPRDIYIGKDAAGALASPPTTTANTGVYGNVFIGRKAASVLPQGKTSVIIGDRAGKELLSSIHNTIIGAGASEAPDYTAIPNFVNMSLQDLRESYYLNWNTIVGSVAGRNNVGSYNVFLGTEAGQYITSGSDNIAVGVGALADYRYPSNELKTGIMNIHIGEYTGTKYDYLSDTIALGNEAFVTENNQLVVGSNLYTRCDGSECYDIHYQACNLPGTLSCDPSVHGSIRESYWGSGVETDWRGQEPKHFTFNATGGAGTDVRGADLILAGGKSTGNANGGRLVFKTSPKATSSGSGQNELVDRMIIDSEGRIGIGTSPKTTAQINVAANRQIALNINQEVSNGSPSYVVMNSVTRSDTSNMDNEIVGFQNSIFLKNSANIGGENTAIYPFNTTINYESVTSGTSYVDSDIFTTAYFAHQNAVGNNRNFNILKPASSIESWGVIDGVGKLTYSDFRHVWLKNSYGANLTKQTGLWIDKQTQGATNHGIVLNGDGAGSDIAFGPGQEARIYSENGYLKAQDIRGNITQFSPHDPETGEWVFYSKNIKTGRVVRVNMEELVRDMEKLTGKKYLIESFVNNNL
jgi:hypothetical protein